MLIVQCLLQARFDSELSLRRVLATLAMANSWFIHTGSGDGEPGSWGPYDFPAWTVIWVLIFQKSVNS